MLAATSALADREFHQRAVARAIRWALASTISAELSVNWAQRSALSNRGVGVVTGRVDIGPRWPLNPEDAYVDESGLRHLLLQLSGCMEEGVGEPESGVVHAAGQHRHQPSRDVGGEAAALRPVKDRYEPSDGRGKQDPARPQHSPRFDERQQPLSSTHEVVERAKEEHRVNRHIRLREPTGIADFSGHQPVPGCGSDIPRDDVDQMQR
jgi:hypothetical protein